MRSYCCTNDRRRSKHCPSGHLISQFRFCEKRAVEVKAQPKMTQPLQISPSRQLACQGWPRCSHADHTASTLQCAQHRGHRQGSGRRIGWGVAGGESPNQGKQRSNGTLPTGSTVSFPALPPRRFQISHLPTITIKRAVCGFSVCFIHPHPSHKQPGGLPT